MAFNLPVPDGELGASFVKDGLLVNGETIPYTDIKKFVASDDELTVEFKDGVVNAAGEPREELVFVIEEGCSHQLLDLETFISTHLMQTNKAVMDEKKEKITNLPEFNMRKIRKSFTRAYSFGK